jgi:hypothetical protein
MKSPFAQPEKSRVANVNPARATERIVSSKSDTRKERLSPPRRQVRSTRRSAASNERGFDASNCWRHNHHPKRIVPAAARGLDSSRFAPLGMLSITL